jgi:transcriptional regulator with XRE-family HTH domain
MTRVGSLIKKHRHRQQITQASIATQLGFSTIQFISNLERGIALVPDNKIKKLCKLLDLQPKVMCDAKLKDLGEAMYKRVGI